MNLLQDRNKSLEEEGVTIESISKLFEDNFVGVILTLDKVESSGSQYHPLFFYDLPTLFLI